MFVFEIFELFIPILLAIELDMSTNHRHVQFRVTTLGTAEC
jgi:hypothetical protein